MLIQHTELSLFRIGILNNWNLENVGILKPQRLQLPSTYGSNWIGLGTGDGNDYTTYNVKFRTHNGLAFTDNSDSATVIVQVVKVVSWVKTLIMSIVREV